MKKWTLFLLPLIILITWSSHRAQAFSFHQRRCLYAQRQHGEDQKTVFTGVNCPHGVVKREPIEVTNRRTKGVTTLIVKCHTNDCQLTQTIIRKYAGINQRLPDWDTQTR